MSFISPSKKPDMIVSISMISTGMSLPVMLYLSCLRPSSVSLTIQCIMFPLGTMQAIIQSAPMNCFTVNLTGTGLLSVLSSQSPYMAIFYNNLMYKPMTFTKLFKIVFILIILVEYRSFMEHSTKFNKIFVINPFRDVYSIGRITAYLNCF